MFKRKKPSHVQKPTAPEQAQAASAPVVAPGDYSITSYSQEGEDVVLRRFLKKERGGFYIDIGAHHPERFSNTLYYYLQDWHGINVDADPDLIEDFNASRPRDINLAVAVGKSSKPLTFFVFNERAVNTFDETLAKERAKVAGWEIVEKRDIPVLSLKELLDKNLPKGQHIDFMSVDVEGQDLEVLKSNDWSIYRPDFIVVETYSITSLLDLSKDPFVMFLKTKGYIPIAKTYYSATFANQESYAKN